MRRQASRITLGLSFAAAALASLAAGLATTSAHATPQAQSTLSVRMHDYAVDLSSRSVPAGLTRIRVTTSGSARHGLLLARLHDGVTVSRFKHALDTKDGLAALPLASFDGGVDTLPGPGQAWQMITALRPGTYVLVDGEENGPRPNFDRGAIAALHVTTPIGTSAAAPKAAGSIGMVDFAFRIHLPASFHGHGWVRFANRGHDIHRIILLRLDPGVSFASAYAAIHGHKDGNKQERPPGQPIELISAVSPGFVGYLKLSLPPGRYVAACFEADQSTHLVPHTELGMIGHFTIA